MSLQADCPSCVTGDHDGHDANWGITPGLIGGSYCGCEGDCAERVKAREEDFQKWFDEYTSMPSGGPLPDDRGRKSRRVKRIDE